MSSQNPTREDCCFRRSEYAIAAYTARRWVPVNYLGSIVHETELVRASLQTNTQFPRMDEWRDDRKCIAGVSKVGLHCERCGVCGDPNSEMLLHKFERFCSFVVDGWSMFDAIDQSFNVGIVHRELCGSNFLINCTVLSSYVTCRRTPEEPAPIMLNRAG